MNTWQKTFKFYFPHEGTYQIQSAYISRSGQMIAFDSKLPTSARVVQAYEDADRPAETLQSVLSEGTSEQIISYLKNENKNVAECLH